MPLVPSEVVGVAHLVFLIPLSHVAGPPSAGTRPSHRDNHLYTHRGVAVHSIQASSGGGKQPLCVPPRGFTARGTHRPPRRNSMAANDLRRGRFSRFFPHLWQDWHTSPSRRAVGTPASVGKGIGLPAIFRLTTPIFRLPTPNFCLLTSLLSSLYPLLNICQLSSGISYRLPSATPCAAMLYGQENSLRRWPRDLARKTAPSP
jgi:hypothetical protein